MGTTPTATDNVTELLQNLKVDPQSAVRDPLEAPNNPNNVQGASLEVSIAGAGEGSTNSVAYEVGMDMYYAINGYATPHGYYYGGYDYPFSDWDDYSRHAGSDGVNNQNPGVYNENGPVLYHPAGYAYGQHVYGPYSSGAPIPRAESQMYSGQEYSYAYPHSVPPNVPFIPSSNAEALVTRANENASDRLVRPSLNMNNNGGPLDARAGYLPHSSGPYGRGIFPVSLPVAGSQDVRVSGYEGPGSRALWSNSYKGGEVQPRHGMLPVSIPGQSSRLVPPMPPHFASGQPPRPRFGVAPGTGGLGRTFQHPARMFPGPGNPGRTAPGLGSTSWEARGNARNWYLLEKGRNQGRANGMISNGNVNLDILNEQNRGPRTTRSQAQRLPPGSVRYIQGQGLSNGSPDSLPTAVNLEQYNIPDFLTKYDNAKFLIIKSYSEDDIHKSIKYSVWASTINGNKKLDAVYQEVSGNSDYTPVFLFFSVNASGQFCGVAEMIGPVDFNKNLDFWQQDKWTGRFPVKWHIIKDVPNGQFRHIVLENNDNKPVTNSRDTQEVKLEQGLEMLNIFKNFSLKSSILDDFQFYESRQKLIQEKRTRQQVQIQQQQVIRRINKDMEQTGSKDNRSIVIVPGKRQEGASANEVHVSRILTRAESYGSSSMEDSDAKLNPNDASLASCEKK